MDTRTTSSTDVCVLLSRVAALLADAGPGALSAALDDIATSLALRSAVLRDAGHGGDLRAVAGDVVHAVPRTRLLEVVSPADSVIELPVHVVGRLAGTLTVVGARPSQLPALRACAAVIALALSARQAAASDAAPGLALALLQSADDDADDAADALHDGPVQDLVAARYAADAAVRGGDPTSARDAVQTALVALRRALWMLRPRAADGLAPALAVLSTHLVEAGRPALRLDLDALACATMSGPAASACYRLVQAVASPAGAPAVAVTVRRAGTDLVMQVDGGATLPAPDRWSVRARAVGATLAVPAPSGTGLVLTVPVSARPEKK